MFTAVIHEYPDHTGTPHCCHGAVGQHHQRSSGGLNYHVCDMVATRASLSGNSTSIVANRCFMWFRPLAAWNVIFVTDAKVGRDFTIRGWGKNDPPS